MIMIRKIVQRHSMAVRRWCSSQATRLAEEEETPVHLRAYDASRYEVPNEQVKYSTGYAFLDVDPFPRASIMKLSHAILNKLESQIPAEAMYRIYTEEQIKYIMNLTD